MTRCPPPPPEVAAVLAAAEPGARQGLLALRGLIFQGAADKPEVGALTEALRWGQPAYLTLQTGAGSSLRIGPTPDGFALFVHCRTTLIADFIAGPGAGLKAGCRTDGSRAVRFRTAGDIDPVAIGFLIRAALTWHRRHRE